MTDSMSPFAREIMINRYAMTLPEGRVETWPEIAHRVAVNVMGALGYGEHSSMVTLVSSAIKDRKFIPGGRYLYASGRKFHQVQNCILMRADDTREGWGSIMHHTTLSLMTGAGLGVNYSGLRHEGSALGAAGGTSSGPLALAQMVNEVARGARQGGARRGAIWGGLRWSHPDIHKWIASKNWSADVRRLKAADFNFPAPLDHTNISVCLDDAFFAAYHDHADPMHARADAVFWEVVRGMCETGEPGFSVDVGDNAGEDLRNACTEITSRDDSDVCNIGSINLARVASIAEMRTLVELGTLFLLAGTVYSDLPYEKVAKVRDDNRRLGLGLMGVHEWLLMHGKRYEPCQQLSDYLEEYERAGEFAFKQARACGFRIPIKTRAIAPNGTIGIVAETTTSAEPIFCSAYKRRYRDGDTWKFQYVVDPTAAKLIAQGVDPARIEDAYTLSEDVERRVNFQAWVQERVDQGISSTINLPPWGTPYNNPETVRPFGHMLLKHLPNLRGITAYPDGARDGQPLNRVPIAEALAHVGEVFIEGADVCEIGRGGSCG